MSTGDVSRVQADQGEEKCKESPPKVDIMGLVKQIGGRKHRKFKRDPEDRKRVHLVKADYCDPYFEFDKVKDVDGNVYLRITSERNDTGVYKTAMFFGDLITEVEGIQAAQVEKLPEAPYSLTVLKYHTFRMYHMRIDALNKLRSQRPVVVRVKRIRPAAETGSTFADFGFELYSMRTWDEYEQDFSSLYLVIKVDDAFEAINPPNEKLFIGDVIMRIDNVKLYGRDKEVLEVAFRTFKGDEMDLHVLPFSSLRGYSLLREMVPV